MQNYYYGDPKRLDLSKMRMEATQKSNGDMYRDPEEVVIHFHKHDEACVHFEHESYPAVVNGD